MEWWRFYYFKYWMGLWFTKSNKKMLVYFQTFEKVVAVESMYDNTYGMVGATLCDHVDQLSVAYCYQTA